MMEPILELLARDYPLHASKPRDPNLIDRVKLPKESKPLREEDKRRRTILVVEDEQEVREALLETLAEEGYGVTAVRNGVEAIKVLTYGHRLPDLILLDLMMPVMDGWEFQRKMEKHLKWKDIPIIIYSANTKIKPVKATLVLAKPCTLEQLVAAISAHIKPEE